MAILEPNVKPVHIKSMWKLSWGLEITAKAFSSLLYTVKQNFPITRDLPLCPPVSQKEWLLSPLDKQKTTNNKRIKYSENQLFLKKH